MDKIPCPAAGIISSGSKYLVIRFSNPKRFTPAAARINALYCPESNFARRVITFPLHPLNCACGYRVLNCNILRRLEQPIGRLKSISSLPSGKTKTSLGSSLLENATIGSSFGISIGISFKLCTDKSVRLSSKARSSSLTKSPFPPTWSKFLSRIISPVVFIVTSSTCLSGKCSFI